MGIRTSSATHRLGGTLASARFDARRRAGTMTPVAAARLWAPCTSGIPARVPARLVPPATRSTPRSSTTGAHDLPGLHSQVNQLAKLFRIGIRERDRIGVLTRNHRGFIMALCARPPGTDRPVQHWGIGRADPRGRARTSWTSCSSTRNSSHCPGDRRLPCHRRPRIRRHHQAHPRGRGSLPWTQNRDALALEDHATQRGWRTEPVLRTTRPSRRSRPARAATIILTSEPAPRAAPAARNRRATTGILDHERIPLRRAPFYLAAPMFHTWGFANIQLALALRSRVDAQVPEDAAAVEANRPALRSPSRQRCCADCWRPYRGHGSRHERSLRLPVSRSAADRGKTSEVGPALHNLMVPPGQLGHDRQPDKSAPRIPRASLRWPRSSGPGRDCRSARRGGRIRRQQHDVRGYTRPGKDKETLEGDATSTWVLGGRPAVSVTFDDMVVSGGENVYPTDTEHIIGTLPESSSLRPGCSGR